MNNYTNEIECLNQIKWISSKNYYMNPGTYLVKYKTLGNSIHIQTVEINKGISFGSFIERSHFELLPIHIYKINDIY